MPLYTDAARNGLPRPLGRPSAMTEAYGTAGDDNLTKVKLPIIGNAYVNKKCAEAYIGVFEDIEKYGLAGHVDKADYGGTYCYRKVRGGNVLSPHSWGVAIDLNVTHLMKNGEEVKGGATNFQCSAAQVATSLKALAPVFAKWGFAWGGWWSGYLDPMHFEATEITLKILDGKTFDGKADFDAQVKKLMAGITSVKYGEEGSAIKIINQASGLVVATGKVIDGTVWAPIRATVESIGGIVTSHVADQGKVYIKKA